MAELEYFMQGIPGQDDDFIKRVSELLSDPQYDRIWILSAFVTGNAVSKLAAGIRASKAEITVISGIRNGITTYRGLQMLQELGVEIYTVDTTIAGDIFHVKTVACHGKSRGVVVCGSMNLTMGGMRKNIEAGTFAMLDWKRKGDVKYWNQTLEQILAVTHMPASRVQRLKGTADLVLLEADGAFKSESWWRRLLGKIRIG